MADTAAGILFDTMREWGVDTVFGLPGDGINGLMEALRERRDRIRFIQVRHEESAALMACGHARYTGKLGVCLATSGPGGIHLLSGVYNAKLEGLPIVAITGHHYHDLIGTHAQQDVDLEKLFTDATVYSERVMGPGHVENLGNVACRTALAARGAAHINFPADMQSWRGQHRSARNKEHEEAQFLARPAGALAHRELAAAAELLNRAERVVILAGQGALCAGAELEDIAGRLAAPVLRSLSGASALPDESPVCAGDLGPLGSPAAREAIAGCDALLLLGTSFPGAEHLPGQGHVPAVQIDADPGSIGLAYPIRVGLIGDAGRALQRLGPLLSRKQDRSFLERIMDQARRWRKEMDAAQDEGAEGDLGGVRAIARGLGRRLDEGAVVSADAGTPAAWAARMIPVKRGQIHAGTGTSPVPRGLPYAIAAQLAFPGRQSVAVVDDVGFAYLMADFVTAVKYELPIRVLLLRDTAAGGPMDFAAFARACGGTGLIIEDGTGHDAVLREALAAPGPSLVEARLPGYRAALRCRSA